MCTAKHKMFSTLERSAQLFDLAQDGALECPTRWDEMPHAKPHVSLSFGAALMW